MANEIKEHEDYNFVDGVAPEGIVSPSADALIEKAESKYGLVIFGARRARQINAYYANLQDNTAAHVGPLVDAESNEKSLSVAMREIIADRVVAEHHPDAKLDEDGYPIPSPQVAKRLLLSKRLSSTSPLSNLLLQGFFDVPCALSLVLEGALLRIRRRCSFVFLRRMATR